MASQSEASAEEQPSTVAERPSLRLAYPTHHGLIEPDLPRIDSFIAEITGVYPLTDLSQLVAETLAVTNSLPKLPITPHIYYGTKLRNKIGKGILKPALAFLRRGFRTLAPTASRPTSQGRSAERSSPADAPTAPRSPNKLIPLATKCVRYVDVVRTIAVEHKVETSAESEREGHAYKSCALNPALELDSRSKSFSPPYSVSLLKTPRTPEEALVPAERSYSFVSSPWRNLDSRQQVALEDELLQNAERDTETIAFEDSTDDHLLGYSDADKIDSVSSWGNRSVVDLSIPLESIKESDDPTPENFGADIDCDQDKAPTLSRIVFPPAESARDKNASNAEGSESETKEKVVAPASRLFSEQENKAILELLDTDPQKRRVDALDKSADIFSRLHCMRNIPWQGRLEMCRYGEKVALARGEEARMGPTDSLRNSAFNGMELIVLVSGEAVLIEKEEDSRKASSEAFAVGVGQSVDTILRKLGPGDDLLFPSEHQAKNGNEGNPQNKVIRARRDCVWLAISTEAYGKALHLDSIPARSRVTALLRKCTLFSTSLHTEDLEVLTDLFKVERHAKGSVLLRAWEPSACIYIIESGECSVVSGLLGLKSEDEGGFSGCQKSNDSLHLLDLKFGDCFGDASIIGKQRLWASLTTTTSCNLLVLRLSDLREALPTLSSQGVFKLLENVANRSKRLLHGALAIQSKMLEAGELAQEQLTLKMQKIMAEFTASGRIRKVDGSSVQPNPTAASEAATSCNIANVPSTIKRDKQAERDHEIEQQGRAVAEGKKLKVVELDEETKMDRVSCGTLTVSVPAPWPKHPVAPPPTPDLHKWKQISQAFSPQIDEKETEALDDCTDDCEADAPTPRITVHSHNQPVPKDQTSPSEASGALSEHGTGPKGRVHGFLVGDEDDGGGGQSIHNRSLWVRNRYRGWWHGNKESPHDEASEDVYVSFGSASKTKAVAPEVVPMQTSKFLDEKTGEEVNKESKGGKRKSGEILKHVPRSFHPVKRQPLSRREDKMLHERWTVPKFHSEEGFPDGLYDENNQILYFY